MKYCEKHEVINKLIVRTNHISNCDVDKVFIKCCEY